ncbi:MAG: RNA polymerase sigma factor [bacterium]
MDERQLVAKAQSGDFDAFLLLVNDHKGKVYNLALKMTGSVQDAEDIVQDTLVKAIDKIDQFRGESAFGTWLYSIALNQTRALLATNKRTDLMPVEEYLPSNNLHDNQENSLRLFDWKDPHKLLEQNELRAIIDEAIETLPLKYKEAFILRYYEELSIKEVADLLGESVASAKSRVLRARLALRDHLSKVFEGHYGRTLQ